MFIQVLYHIITEGPTDTIQTGMLSVGIESVGMFLHNIIRPVQLLLITNDIEIWFRLGLVQLMIC